MKKLVLLLLALASLSVVSAQKCNYIKNEKDKFSGKKLIATEAQLFVEFTKRADIVFALSEDTLIIQINYVEGSPQSIECDLSSELSLSLSDGSVVKLKPLEPKKGRVKTTGAGLTESFFQPIYMITIAQLETFSTNAITAFRMTHSQGAVQKEVPEKNQKKIKASALCLLQGL